MVVWFFGFDLALILVAMTLLWVVSLVVRDASIVDVFWGLAFVLIAWSAFIRRPVPSPDRTDLAWLVVALVTIWGVRLSVHLARRNLGKGEDFRYVRMRERFGPRFPVISLVVVFLFQGVLAWIVSLPVQAAIAFGFSDGAWTLALVVAGVAVWAVGIAFETVGDLQLAAFKRDPANKAGVMDRGLWRYTRHPNYFGDACVWWGLWLLAASTGALWTVIGPILMTILLVRVSGKGLLERTIGERRPGYAAYVKRTSGFFPLPPKRS